MATSRSIAVLCCSTVFIVYLEVFGSNIRQLNTFCPIMDLVSNQLGMCDSVSEISYPKNDIQYTFSSTKFQEKI